MAAAVLLLARLRMGYARTCRTKLAPKIFVAGMVVALATAFSPAVAAFKLQLVDQFAMVGAAFRSGRSPCGYRPSAMAD